MTTITVGGLHAQLSLTATETSQLNEVIEHVEAGGSMSRLFDLFNELLSARSLEPIAERLSWTLVKGDQLTLHHTT